MALVGVLLAGGLPAAVGAALGPAAPTPPPPLPPAPPTIRVIEVGGAVTDIADVWANFSRAGPEWARRRAASWALAGGGTYAMYMWSDGPVFTADYSAQGGLIAEKALALGGAFDAQVVAWQLAALPLAQDGKPWAAQGSEWHTGAQGAWEAGGEVLQALRHYAAHTGDAAPFRAPPERLACASTDGGASWALVGAPQEGLTDAVCGAPPVGLATLPGAPGGPPNMTAFAAAAPYLLFDTPSPPFTKPAPVPGPPPVPNGGRLLTSALVLPGPARTTHLALPLTRKAAGNPLGWGANATVWEVASGALVGWADVPGDAAGVGDAWTVVPLAAAGGAGGGAPPGTYLVVLTAHGAPPPGASTPPNAGWYEGVSWVTNWHPGGAGGGAGAGTYTGGSLWLRNTSAPPGRPALARVEVPDPDAAVRAELARVRAAAARGAPALGRSLGDAAGLVLGHVLALASQVAGSAAPGGYDVPVIPDPLYRGSGEPGVSSGAAYYDVQRAGFASSYVGLRLLEGVRAYVELQDAGLLPAGCDGRGGSAVGVDNARALVDGATPCYTRADVGAADAAITAAIGGRFGDASTGGFLDWVGCTCLGAPGAAAPDCGLEGVANATLPSSGPGAGCLRTVDTGFLPTLALAAKLGVPAGGVSLNATAAAFAAARDVTGRGVGNATAPGGFWMLSRRGFESPEGGGAGSWIADVTWALRDADGYAERSASQTGDWHLFPPASLAAGGAPGYGNWPANSENGGRFFSTSAFVWEAHAAPGGAVPGVYPRMYHDWALLAGGVGAVGERLAANDTSTPLAQGLAPGFLARPVTDPLVRALCLARRANMSIGHTRDDWGQLLCDYYQELGFALPESGQAFLAFAKGLLGLRVLASGHVRLMGRVSPAPVNATFAPWVFSAPAPDGWPPDAQAVAVVGLAVGGQAVDLACDAVGGVVAACTVERADPDSAARRLGAVGGGGGGGGSLRGAHEGRPRGH